MGKKAIVTFILVFCAIVGSYFQFVDHPETIENLKIKLNSFFDTGNQERPSKDFNIIYEYELEKSIDLAENKLLIGGICYPKTKFNISFTEEEINEIYSIIMRNDLINFNWSHTMNILYDSEATCLLSTSSSSIFSLTIIMGNKSNKIILDKNECCCNIRTIKDVQVLKIINKTKEVIDLSNEIESIINKKIISLNISLPEPIQDCGYI